MCLNENFYLQIIVIISSHFSHTLLKHFQDTAVLISSHFTCRVNRVGITATCQNTKESMDALQCLCPSLLFQRQAFSARVFLHGWYKKKGGECWAAVHRMCVGSVRVMVGSSSIPTGSASKWFFKKNSASVTLEAVWRILTTCETARGI